MITEAPLKNTPSFTSTCPAPNQAATKPTGSHHKAMQTRKTRTERFQSVGGFDDGALEGSPPSDGGETGTAGRIPCHRRLITNAIKSRRGNGRPQRIPSQVPRAINQSLGVRSHRVDKRIRATPMSATTAG